MEIPENELLLQFTREFNTLMPTQLPVLLSEKNRYFQMAYEDYTQLNYHVTKRLTIAQVSDMLEDQANLKLLYHKHKSDGLKGWQICCAFTNPCFRRMYKFNAEADDQGIVHTMTVYVFHSMETMRGYLLNELREHRKRGGMVYEMSDAEVINTFV